jgi:hypothetical protein
MAPDAKSIVLAAQARRAYVDGLLKGMPVVLQAIDTAARIQLGQVADPALVLKRRETVDDLKRHGTLWLHSIQDQLRASQSSGLLEPTRPGDGPGGRGLDLSLVEDSAIESEILSSRLSLAIMDRASWEFSDLRSRITSLEARDELEPQDILRPHVLARAVTAAWQRAGLSQDNWRIVQGAIHGEFAHFAEEAYHEINRMLVEKGVLPEIDLRPFIRRARDTGIPSAGPGPAGDATSTFDPRRTGVFVPNRTTTFSPGSTTTFEPQRNPGFEPGRTTTFQPGRNTTFQPGATTTFEPGRTNTFAPTSVGTRSGGIQDETRLQTRTSPFARVESQAEAVLGRLNRLIGRQLPEFAATSVAQPAASPALVSAIGQAQQGIALRLSATADPGGEAAVVGTPTMLEELQQRKQALKQAATTPIERATIEVVALLFQSLLTEERLPATVRVWFARLQMPVLRVAISEPDFFAASDHPARRLIDRMGACVMGFDATLSKAGELLEREIKRVVQVVEAYPDTGRRVFQTVLNEFEKFLENFFKNDNEASRKGVSLAQQVEQRETLAIQYTIELRKMLSEVPVQEGVRDFLFQVWADVLAITAVKQGLQSEATKEMKRAAADLIWSASAKTSRDERATVIRRLPPLLKQLREGMASAGIPPGRQDEHIQKLNNSLAAAFTARVATISKERMDELKARLDTLEELLPDAGDVEIDESMVLDLSDHESSELEVVGEGGSMPTPEMVEWAKELQVGTWYLLDYRNRNDSVQLAWRGMRQQLTLFVTQQGRGVLFQQHRLAAFLQAGLLVPVQEEALTVKATRSALAKIDADPTRLQN